MKKVNKWKRLAALGVSAMMIFSTVACGSDSKEGSKTDDGDVKKSTKGTTISFWNSFTGSDGDMLVELVNRYNEENKDGITVEMDISSDFDSQLSTAFAAGT